MATCVRQGHTGAEYFDYIRSVESDRRAREAFLELGVALVPPGGTVFDFGAGPGIDAKFFAERGFNVRAFDVDPAMCEFFTEYCAEFMAQGRVVLERGSYREFLARPETSSPADLVISNFAPLNLVDDPHELFAKFHALTHANGRVLASVINPYFLDDAKYPWWWITLPRLRRDGCLFMPGPRQPHMRRLPGNFATLSAPYFKLTGVHRGLPGRSGRSSWLGTARARFLFLVFEKTAT